MHGLTNHREYYTEHYFAELLAGDLKDTLAEWKATALEHPDSEDHREPPARLRGLARDYFKTIELLQRSAGDEDTIATRQRTFLSSLLPILGYSQQPTFRALGEGSSAIRIPLLGEVPTQSGAPALWLIEALPPGTSDDDLASDPLSLSPQPIQYADDPQHDDPQLPGAPPKSEPGEPDRTWEDILSKDIYGLEEPPRWVLFLSLGQIVLCDRMKWAERRFLSFDLREIFNRRDDPTFRATAALLHRDSTCPADGLSLLDGLDESSHKHAFAVSEDLKLAVVASIEDIANEAVWYIRNVRKEGVFNQPDEKLEYELTRGCLRYLYRLLFCFYLEARPELGYLPVKSEEYLKGYSIESLRDLEMIELETDEMRDGYFLHDSIKTLFRLIYEGRQHIEGDALGLKDHGRQSIHQDFEIAPLQSHLFDPKGTPYLSKVRLRNHVLQRVIQRLSLGNTGRGRKSRAGRISYATLGINQLGAVYENLLSYTGFFAKEELFEVKPAKEDHNPLEHAYFVTAAQLEDYTDDERVYETVKVGADSAKSLLRHEKGKFIYRLAGRARKKSASYYTPESLTQCLVKYALKERLQGLDADQILHLTVCEMAVGSAAFLNEAVNQLAEAYLRKKQQELGQTIPHEDYTRERQKVKMFIADNNVFGVDLNPTAVELAEISLWLNTIYEGAFVPWFGLQLANGNSLIGCRRETYATHLLLERKGKGGTKARWPEEAPEAVVRSQESEVSKEEDGALDPRPQDGVYHWLLGDPGMSNYTDKVIKSLAKPQLDKFTVWRKTFVAPFDDTDLPELVALSAAADELFRRHLEATQRVRRETTDPLAVWPAKNPSSGKRTTTHWKDSHWALQIKNPGSPYSRLKLAMDYWCALWFWPIDKADLLPTRQQFLTEIGLLLGHLPGFAPVETQTEFASIAVDLGGHIVEVTETDVPPEHQRHRIDDICRDNDRLALVRTIANERKFFHWELEYVDLFAERGGFDVILGNPPWVKVEWKEVPVVSEFAPHVLIRDMSAPDVREWLVDSEILNKQPEAGKLYTAEFEESLGTKNFLNAKQNHPFLAGKQKTLDGCFIERSFSLASGKGVVGLVHDEGLYDDANINKLRAQAYSRLRLRAKFRNELMLFPEVDHNKQFSLNVYGAEQASPHFEFLANIFSPATIDIIYSHSGHGAVPSTKDEQGDWETRGHKDRLIKIDVDAIALFRELLDCEPEDRAPRIPNIHCVALIATLTKLSRFPNRFSGTSGHPSVMWDETNSIKKDGILKANVSFPATSEEVVLSGSHYGLAHPLAKVAGAAFRNKQDFGTTDIEHLPDNYLPRTIYSRAIDRSRYDGHMSKLPWSGQPHGSAPRYAGREMINPMQERTFIGALIPAGFAHVHTTLSYAFEKNRDLVEWTAASHSVPLDYFVKSTGAKHANTSLLASLPFPRVGLRGIVRALALNCLTTHYAELWSECWDEGFHEQRWYGDDPRLDPDFFRKLTPEWGRDCALRTDYARRWALVELDVLVARELGLTLEELQTIYRFQFARCMTYEADTWYDQNGRIVYSTDKFRPGFPRTAKPKDGAPIGWNDIKDLQTGTAQRTILDTTLPTGPLERTITYQAPFTKCNRETDYEQVWEVLDEQNTAAEYTSGE